MAKKCKDCGGRGRWQVQETNSDGDTALIWYDCGTCKATGVVPDDDDDHAPENVYDIGGDSFNDEDD